MPNAVVVKVEKEKILGSGPYKLEEFKRGQAIILRKNPFYHQREFVQLEGIRYTLFQSATAAWAAFSAGRIDVYNIPPEQVDRFTKTAQNPDYSLQKQEKLNIYYLCFNTLLPPFDNLQIRKGINAAINRQKIVDTMLQGCAIPALGPVPPALRQNPPKTSITHDAELAKKLLSEAGITAENPLRFNLVYRASDEIARIILIIKEQLAPFHVLITPEPMEWSGMKARINSGKIALAYLNWTADYPDPRNFLFPLFHSSNAGSGGNRSFYNSAEFDQLITESETLAPGAELTAKYAQLEEKVLSDLPWVFLWHEIEYAIVKNRVNGYQIPQIYSQDRGCGINLDGTTKQ
jgi:ABC-type oligopeptide transport system substrate-binding subunit